MQGEDGRMHHLSKEDTESRHSPCWRLSPCWRSRHRLCSFHSSASISGTGPGLFAAGEHLTSQGLQATTAHLKRAQPSQDRVCMLETGPSC